MITLETNGKRYEGFTTVNVRRSFPVTIWGAFSFNAVSSRAMRFPIELGDPCKVYANGVSIINGYIEKLSISYSNNEHTISIEGRDKTCDIIDSTLNSKAIYNPPITLKKLSRILFRNWEFPV